MSAFTAFAAELLAGLRENSLPPLREQESESGLGTAHALTTIMAQLAGQLPPDQQQTVFSLALAQVDANGQRVNPRQLNKPDISFVADAGGTQRRVNIEIETGDVRKHYKDVNRDRNAHNVFVKIDPWTGAFQSGIVRAPDGTVRHLRSPAEVQQALAALPKAQVDPTLRYRNGVQERKKTSTGPSGTTGPVRTGAMPRISRPAQRPRPRPAAPARTAKRTRGAREFEWEWEFESELERAADEMEG
jgi:hypothetical protein